MGSREHRLSATMDDALRREVRLSEKPDFEMAILRAAQSERFPSGVASAPWLFQRGLTPKNRGADATPLRCLTNDRARYNGIERQPQNPS